MFSSGKSCLLNQFSTFTFLGTTVFEDNIGIIDGSTSYGYLFKLEDLSTNFELNSVETSVTLNGVFYKNYIKNSDALFLANVKTFT